jgi:Flp pilus assembly protein TadD
MKIDSDLLKLLMEMGFLAINAGRLGEAETIFQGVAQARPNSGYPQIGLGCVAMGRGDYDKAAEILRDSPAKEQEERDLCMGFMAMALKLNGRNAECQDVVSRLQAEGKNEVAVRMADKLLKM